MSVVEKVQREYFQAKLQILELSQKIAQIRNRFELGENSFLFALDGLDWKISAGRPHFLNLYEKWDQWGDRPDDLKDWISDKLPVELYSLIDTIEIRMTQSRKDFKHFNRTYYDHPFVRWSLFVNGKYSHDFDPENYIPSKFEPAREIFDISPFLNETFQKILTNHELFHSDL